MNKSLTKRNLIVEEVESKIPNSNTNCNYDPFFIDPNMENKLKMAMIHHYSNKICLTKELLSDKDNLVNCKCGCGFSYHREKT